MLENKPLPDHLEFWESEAFTMRESLERSLGPEPEECPLELKVTEQEGGVRLLEFDTEPGLRIAATHLPGTSKRWVVLLDHEGMETATGSDHAKALQAAGWNVVCADLRAVGKTGIRGDRVGRSPDHNTAEWSLWIGRPLLGQWAHDVRRTIAAVLESIESVPEEIGVVGMGTAGLVAILAAAAEEMIVRVGTTESLSSYILEVPYEQQRMGLMVPGILRAGDVPHLAALVAPRRLLISQPVDGASQPLPEALWEAHFVYPRKIYSILRGREKFVVAGKLGAKEFAARFGEL